MNKDMITVLRERINRYSPEEFRTGFTQVEDEVLVILLNIAERVADVYPYNDMGACVFCYALEGHRHETDCAKEFAEVLKGRKK